MQDISRSWNGCLSTAFEIIVLRLLMPVFFWSLDFELLCLVHWCHSLSFRWQVLHLVGTQEIVVELNHCVALRRYGSKTL